MWREAGIVRMVDDIAVPHCSKWRTHEDIISPYVRPCILSALPQIEMDVRPLIREGLSCCRFREKCTIGSHGNLRISVYPMHHLYGRVTSPETVYRATSDQLCLTDDLRDCDRLAALTDCRHAPVCRLRLCVC